MLWGFALQANVYIANNSATHVPYHPSLDTSGVLIHNIRISQVLHAGWSSRPPLPRWLPRRRRLGRRTRALALRFIRTESTKCGGGSVLRGVRCHLTNSCSFVGFGLGSAFTCHRSQPSSGCGAVSRTKHQCDIFTHKACFVRCRNIYISLTNVEH